MEAHAKNSSAAPFLGAICFFRFSPESTSVFYSGKKRGGKFQESQNARKKNARNLLPLQLPSFFTASVFPLLGPPFIK